MLPTGRSAVSFPNEIVGSPTVHCSQGTISLQLVTSNGLPSRIFAKGRTDVAGCFFENTNNVTFSLSGCNMNRKRQIEPRGVQYGLVVVVQLHPLFITKVDKAYHVQCTYLEAEKMVTSGLEVSMLPTEPPIAESSPMPACQYSLHADSPNGALVKYARIGDKVWHKWECPSGECG